jgi:hypothetical protein
MKILAKFWDIILIAIMGIFGTGCILDPPAPEYGVEPMYGVPAAVRQTDEDLHHETMEPEFKAQ